MNECEFNRITALYFKTQLCAENSANLIQQNRVDFYRKTCMKNFHKRNNFIDIWRILKITITFPTQVVQSGVPLSQSQWVQLHTLPKFNWSLAMLLFWKCARIEVLANRVSRDRWSVLVHIHSSMGIWREVASIASHFIVMILTKRNFIKRMPNRN